jgi:hypothetical protein
MYCKNMGWVLGKSVKNYGFFFIPILTYLKGENFFSPFCDFLFVGSRKLISKREDMKIIKKMPFLLWPYNIFANPNSVVRY